MKFDRFTVKAREAIADAQALAGKQGNPEIRPQHLLLVLLTQDKGVVASLLSHVEVDAAQISREAAVLVDKLPNVSGSAQARVSSQLQKVFSEAEEVARELGVPAILVAFPMEVHLRGRELGAVPALMADELRRIGVPENRIARASTEVEATRLALAWAEPGDLLLLSVLAERDQVIELLGGMVRHRWRPGQVVPN